MKYRGFVGPSSKYDLVGANQFNLLTDQGLRDTHYLLDIGCGSLRGGRLFIPYLLPGHYYGIEPNQWLIDAGIDHELGRGIMLVKRPVFSNDSTFTLTLFKQKFDYLLAQSIFSHASIPQILKCLQEAHACMHTDSKFYATFIQGTKDNSNQEWTYPGGVSYTWNTIRSLVNSRKLKCTILKWIHPVGQKWILITQ